MRNDNLVKMERWTLERKRKGMEGKKFFYAEIAQIPNNHRFALKEANNGA